MPYNSYAHDNKNYLYCLIAFLLLKICRTQWPPVTLTMGGSRTGGAIPAQYNFRAPDIDLMPLHTYPMLL